MAININDNLNTLAAKPTDSRFGVNIIGNNGFYESLTQAREKVPISQRYMGLTLGIRIGGTGPVKEYWYANGITDNDLVEKSGTVSGAGNGLSNTNGTIGLGGTLSQATSITTSANNTLTIGGLQAATNPTHYVSANSSGTLTLSTVLSLQTSIQTNILNSISAANGVNKTNGNVIELGGSLTKATTIGTNSTNTLSLTGLQVNNSPTDVLVTNNTNAITSIPYNTIVSNITNTVTGNVASSITGTNGITKTTSGNNITLKLGGAITETTTLSSISDKLLLTGLINTPGLTSTDVLVVTPSGVVQKFPFATFLTANNGITKEGNNFKLGGDLSPGSSTVINLGPQFDPNNPSQPGADSNFFIANKWINKPFHSEAAFTRTNINFDTFDYVQFLSGSGWVLNEPATPAAIPRWEGNISIGFQRVTPLTSSLFPLRNTTIPVAGAAYYITVYIKPTGTNYSVTGTVDVSFGGATNSTFTNIGETTKGVITVPSLPATPTEGLVVTPTANFNGNIRILIARKSIADTASRTRIISFRGGSAMWTTNFAYINTTTPFQYYLENAFEDYLYSKPWLFRIYPTANYPVGASFQITENLHATTKTSSLSSHYNDERATFASLTWWNTFDSPTTANLYGRFFNEYKESSPGALDGGWKNGQVYTLKEKKPGDQFPASMASSTISGNPNDSGWVFVSNGTIPTGLGGLIWGNGSIIEGDFPIIEKSPKYSAVIATEGQDPGDTFNYQKGIVNIVANTTFVTGLIDQGSSKRGFKLALISNVADLPVDAAVGEMVYLQSSNSIVVKTALGNPDSGWRKVSLGNI